MTDHLSTIEWHISIIFEPVGLAYDRVWILFNDNDTEYVKLLNSFNGLICTIPCDDSITPDVTVKYLQSRGYVSAKVEENMIIVKK